MFGTKILEERKSKYNGKLRVVKTWGTGTYIQANGLTQSGGVVETFWKQTLKKIYKSKVTVSNCLILGLGGGTVVKLVKEIWPDTGITGVDIDPVIVELGKKYLSLDNIPVKIIIKDALQYTKYDMQNTKYDLVIVDLYRGDEFPKKFESDKFLQSLTKNRLVIFNRLYYKDKKILASEFGKKLQKIFKNVEYYYPITNLMLICSC